MAHTRIKLLAFLTIAFGSNSDQVERAMSALGQTQTYAVQKGMSALAHKATSKATYEDVRSGPKATWRLLAPGFADPDTAAEFATDY